MKTPEQLKQNKTEITCACGCNRKKLVRNADIKRGWGKYYSKSCKANHQAKTSKGRKFTYKTICKAFNEGRCSEDYFNYIVINNYPEHATRQMEQDYNNKKYLDSVHPFSDEAFDL